MADQSVRESLFVAAVMGGANDVDAAVAAGWSRKYARASACNIRKRPHVQAAIKAAQEEVRKASCWTAEKLISRLEYTMTVAEAKGQTMTMQKCLETIGRVTGILQDKLRLEVETKLSLIDAIDTGLARAGIPKRYPDSKIIDITPRPAAIAPAERDPFSE